MPNYFRIFGAGEWGLALANHLTEQDNLVEIYIRNSKKIKKISMKFRELGSTGMKISEIGFGTWGIGGNSYGPVDDNVAKALKLSNPNIENTWSGLSTKTNWLDVIAIISSANF